MKRFISFLFIIPLLILAGCTSKSKSNQTTTLLDVQLYLDDIFQSKLSLEQAKSGFNIPLKLFIPFNDTKVSVCLNSFYGYEWKLTGKRCYSDLLNYGLHSIVLPAGPGSIKAKTDNLKRSYNIIVNLCYNNTQIYVLNGCVPSQKNKECSLSVISKNKQRYIMINNANLFFNGTHYILSFSVTYIPKNRTYITDDYNVLNGRCFLTYVLSKTNKIKIKIKLEYITDKKYSYQKEIYLSSGGESKRVAFIINSKNLNGRDLLSFVVYLQYIVFKQQNVGILVISE